MITHLDMIARIATAAALGGVIGFERDIHGRQAGLRTHLLVSMASATFMVVSTQFLFFQGYDPGSHVDADVSRIASTVVSGIGFLAGGAILKTGMSIQGLTTAAALWLVSAIGLAAGGGMYIEGISVTVMGLVALTLLRLFEDKNDKMIRRYVTLEMEYATERISQIMAALNTFGAKVADFDYEKKLEGQSLGITFEVRIPVNPGVPGLIDLLEKQTGVRHVNIRLHD